jgi:hypothetical protein
MKTKESRFQVHDELTAPERSLPVLKGALAAGGQLSNFIGVLAGSPAALRAYARYRSELRNGTLPLKTQQRIALAREFDSSDAREAALLSFIKALVETDEVPPLHLLEEAREAGWSDEQILEAIAYVAQAGFMNLITRAGNIPADGSVEDSRLLNAA